MRGGVSYICKRYSKDNNNYLKSYDLKQKSKHIIYFDADNSFGYAEFLPTGGFKWVDPKNFDSNKIAAIFLKVVF